MPSTSPKQQRFMALVHAVQTGKVSKRKVSGKVKEAAKGMSQKQSEEFMHLKKAAGDPAHNIKHVRAVQREARQLGLLYAPEKLRLIREAARLHDIGRTVTDEGHELAGVKLLTEDPQYRGKWTPEEWAELIEAVREHRASTGKPKGIVARIISDADRLGDPDKMHPLKRAYLYRTTRGFSPDAALSGAVEHLSEKFHPTTGYGRTKIFFPETQAKLTELYDPIFSLMAAGKLAELRRIARIPKTAESLKQLLGRTRFSGSTSPDMPLSAAAVAGGLPVAVTSPAFRWAIANPKVFERQQAAGQQLFTKHLIPMLPAVLFGTDPLPQPGKPQSFAEWLRLAKEALQAR